MNQPEASRSRQIAVLRDCRATSRCCRPFLVRSNEGRPTKIEGNPDHPNNRPGDFPAEDPLSRFTGSSATDIFAQASILSLYDPDRSQDTDFREDIRTWTGFVGAMRSALDEQRPKQGPGIRFLTETIISPTLGAQLKELLTGYRRQSGISTNLRIATMHVLRRCYGSFRSTGKHDL